MANGEVFSKGLHQLVAQWCDHSDDDACAKALQKTHRALILCSAHPKSWATSEMMGAVQNRMPKLLSALYRGSEATRNAAIELLGALLRRGLVKPHNAVAHLVAAHGDASPTVRNTAHELLSLEIWRSPDALNAENVSTGAKACCDLRVAHRAEALKAATGDAQQRIQMAWNAERLDAARAPRPFCPASIARAVSFFTVKRQRRRRRHTPRSPRRSSSACAPARRCGARCCASSSLRWWTRAMRLIRRKTLRRGCATTGASSSSSHRCRTRTASGASSYPSSRITASVAHPSCATVSAPSWCSGTTRSRAMRSSSFFDENARRAARLQWWCGWRSTSQMSAACCPRRQTPRAPSRWPCRTALARRWRRCGRCGCHH